MATMPVCNRLGTALLFIVFVLLVQRPVFAERLTFTTTTAEEDVRIREQAGRLTVDAGREGGGYSRLREEGHPALPYRLINVLLPQGSQVASFGFTPDGEVVLRKGVQLEMAPPELSEDGVPGKGEAMATASKDRRTFPVAWGRYLGTGYLHGRGIASFAVFPLRMQDEALILSERVSLWVETELGLEQEVVTRERYRDGFESKVAQVLEGVVINPEMNSGYQHNQVRVPKRASGKKGGFAPTLYPSLEGSAVDYVIITTDALASEYQRLADFKTLNADGGADGGVDRGEHA
jgi:hypothetical protein